MPAVLTSADDREADRGMLTHEAARSTGTRGVGARSSSTSQQTQVEQHIVAPGADRLEEFDPVRGGNVAGARSRS